MKFEATLVGFPGRPNPMWILNKGQTKQLIKLLESTKTVTLKRPRGVFGILGYAGFLIRVIPSDDCEHIPFNLPKEFHLQSNIIDVGGQRHNFVNDDFYKLQKSWLAFVLTTAKQIRGELPGKNLPIYANFGEDLLKKRIAWSNRESDSDNSESSATGAASADSASKSNSDVQKERIQNQFVDDLVERALHDIEKEEENSEEFQERHSIFQRYFADLSHSPPFNAESPDTFGANVKWLARQYDGNCKNCAPNYEPHWDDGNSFDKTKWSSFSLQCFQHFNNCYNYATSKNNNAYSQPGRSNGIKSVGQLTKDFVKGAKLDGLECAGWKVDKVPKKPSGNSHLIALFVTESGSSYHWLRYDTNDRWSHKNGRFLPTQRDESCKLITDLENIDLGDYKNFVAYFVCDRDSVTIL